MRLVRVGGRGGTGDMVDGIEVGPCVCGDVVGPGGGLFVATVGAAVGAALGAMVVGAGLGGALVVVCPGSMERVRCSEPMIG